MTNNRNINLIIYALLTIAVLWVLYATQGNTQKYSENACTITTGDKNCGQYVK